MIRVVVMLQTNLHLDTSIVCLSYNLILFVAHLLWFRMSRAQGNIYKNLSMVKMLIIFDNSFIIFTFKGRQTIDDTWQALKICQANIFYFRIIRFLTSLKFNNNIITSYLLFWNAMILDFYLNSLWNVYVFFWIKLPWTMQRGIYV